MNKVVLVENTRAIVFDCLFVKMCEYFPKKKYNWGRGNIIDKTL